jgi:TonB-linked SusC/RagA family outer membrane protein
MKQKLLIIFCISFLFIQQTFAQNRTITGVVTDKEDGQPIPGATVRVAGTTVGALSDKDGKYSIIAADGQSISVSFIGYVSQTLPVIGKSKVNFILTGTANQLGEVVVTGALGIKHSEKELGYAVAKVTAKELTLTNVTNIANGLTAKISGLGVYTLDNGVDPNVAIVLRGNRSLQGNNNALIVLDGVPIPGATLGSINPNDIADVSILKGAGSAALYGSEASNGAILITTKRGTSDGKPVITYQNSFQFEKVAFYPKLQTRFGIYGGESLASGYVDPITGAPRYVPYENQQYGPEYDGSMVQLGAPIGSPDGPVQMVKYSPFPTSPIKAFFETGITEQNDISFSQGDSKNSFFISAQNAYRTTVVPNDKNIKNAFSIRGHRTYGIFSADYSVGYTRTSISTYATPAQGGGSYVTTSGYADLYSSILQLPAFLDIKKYKDPDGYYGNASDYYDAYAINPYWVVNKSRVNSQRDVILSSLNLKLDPTNWLTASYHISNNFGIAQQRFTQQEVNFTDYALSDYFSAGNTPSGFKTTGKAPGRLYDFYSYGDGTTNPDGYARVQGDAILDFHHTFAKDFKVNLIVGNTIWERNLKSQFTGSNSLLLKDFYNINTIGGLVTASERQEKIRQISYFSDLTINYKGYLTLDMTFRNEQDSRLAKAQRSFNYPSAKIAFIPTDAFGFLKNNSILNYAKIYGSVSRVGNISVGPYTINNVFTLSPGFPYGSLGGLSASTDNFSSSLKPELTSEIEVGTELSFFNSRLGLNLTYYNQHVKNQTVPINTSITTGYNTSLINIGETKSSGTEIQVTGDVLTQAQNKVGLRLGANFSNNESEVVSLLPGVNSLNLGFSQYAEVGKPFPLLKGTDFERDAQGRVIVDSKTGYPSTAQGLTTFGRTTPKYNLGLTAAVSYKIVTLSAVAEYRGGSVVFNGIGQALTFSGAGYTTASAGRQPFVYPNSVIETAPGVFTPNTNVSVQNGNYGFWQSSAYPNTQSPFVSSGAFWKIREASLSFNLNSLVRKSKYINGASLSLTGRNLFIFVPKSNPWTDPEFAAVDPTTNTRGVNNVGQTPGTRVFGANLKLTF